MRLLLCKLRSLHFILAYFPYEDFRVSQIHSLSGSSLPVVSTLWGLPASDFPLQSFTQTPLEPPSSCSALIVTPQTDASALTLARHTSQPGTYTSSPERALGGFNLPPNQPENGWNWRNDGFQNTGHQSMVWASGKDSDLWETGRKQDEPCSCSSLPSWGCGTGWGHQTERTPCAKETELRVQIDQRSYSS